VNPSVVIEVLTPDFNENETAIETVLRAWPQVFNHNLETVRRLTPLVRSRATYERSLRVLRQVKVRQGSDGFTKSGFMVGLGETEGEVIAAMKDLREAGCELLTLGQYLQPTRENLPVVEFIAPEQFARYAQTAGDLGFAHVASGPRVRSSYHAADFLPNLASLAVKAGQGPAQDQESNDHHHPQEH
jgi:lipoic acid synthetase